MQSASAEHLVDVLGITSDDASSFKQLAASCQTFESFKFAVEECGTLPSKALAHIADTSTAAIAFTEACEVFDMLFFPPTHPPPVELESLCKRRPLAYWSKHASLTFTMVTTVLKHAQELATKCSILQQSKQDFADPSNAGKPSHVNPNDLHAGHLYLPLLHLALSSLRYKQLSLAQKRVAWHAAQRLARAAHVTLQQPAAPPRTQSEVSSKLSLVPNAQLAYLRDGTVRASGTHDDPFATHALPLTTCPPAL